jgi:hypothetical protein
MQLNYILTDPSFFSNEGRSGQVSHALGIIEGLHANGVKLNVVSEENIQRYIDNSSLNDINLQTIEKGSGIIGSFIFAINCIRQAKLNGNDLLIRKCSKLDIFIYK